MAIFDFLRRSPKTTVAVERPLSEEPVKQKICVGASNEHDETQIQSFSNSNITFSGELADYDYDSILRDKQENIVSLYQLADYYCDADPIVRGIIKHCYVPYSGSSKWVLTGAKDKTIKLFEDYYKKIRLKEKIDSIFTEYWKYSNVFLYVLDGNIITLPVHKCKIGSTSLNGQPIVDYDCMSIQNEWKAKGYSVHEGWIEENNLEYYFKGYPPELKEALDKGWQYAQLNPENTFVMQSPKEGWQRYAVPFIASCLSALAKKELISKYEDSMLNLGIRAFVHVKYGDPNNDTLPNREELVAARSLFQKGMSGFPLVVTNQLASAELIQCDLDDLFQWDKYKNVNQDILSAGGISGIVVNGVSDDGSSFSTAQVSMQTAESRIEDARNEFCDIMNRINERLVEYISGTYNLKQIPEFHFMPLEMSGKKALRDACTELWTEGLVSTKTMLDTYGYSLDLEKEQREKEAKDKTDEVMMSRDAMQALQTQATSSDSESSGSDSAGRNKLDDDERVSDPANSARSAQPKPSNPEGSKSKDS